MRNPHQSNIACYHCGSLETTRIGSKPGKQPYYCQACRRLFRWDPDSSESVDFGRWHPKSLPSQNQLILELQAIAQRIGKIPSSEDIDRLEKAGEAHPRHHYYYVFGSFNEALNKAGLKVSIGFHQ